NFPSLNQTTPRRPSDAFSCFGRFEKPAVLIGTGSGKFHERASGATCAMVDGVQRNAALGTKSALVSSRAAKRTLAVRYGSKSLSGFSVFTSTVYMTTFWVMVAFRRILPTVPLNSRPGKVSQVNVTVAPGTIRPTSASFTETQICIL